MMTVSTMFFNFLRERRQFWLEISPYLTVGEIKYRRKDLIPNAANEDWDGTYKGKKMDSGIYAFFAEVEFLNGTIEIFKGDLTLSY